MYIINNKIINNIYIYIYLFYINIKVYIYILYCIKNNLNTLQKYLYNINIYFRLDSINFKLNLILSTIYLLSIKYKKHLSFQVASN